MAQEEQMTQLWTLLRAEPCISLGIWELHYPCHTAVALFCFSLRAISGVVEQFLLSVLQPGVGTVDVSDHQLTAAGQERGIKEVYTTM